MKKDYIRIPNKVSTLDESVFVEEHWTKIWDSHNVNEFVKRQIEARDEFKIMDPYLSKLPPQSRILDGGCGLGEWTLYYTSRGFEVAGLDISRATIERLNERFPNHRFTTGDVRNTKFDEESFDAYFSWGTFEHFEDGLGSCFKEARRIVKKEGYLFISVPFQNGRHLRRDKRELSRWDKNFYKKEGYTSEMRFYQWRLTIPELQREFEINGFRAIRIEAIHKWHGLHRAITSDLRIGASTKLHRIIQVLLYPFLPKSYVAHMIMGVGQKR